MKLKKAISLIIVILLIDQISKIYIKTHFYLGQEIVIFNGFRIHFLENNGMAWGVELGGSYGKLFLSIFRIIAIMGLGYWLYTAAVRDKLSGKIVSAISLIVAGALGNIIDSVFYGVIFSDTYHGVARIFPKEGGYSSLFHGKVVDMLYFPIVNTTLPNWLPFIGGTHFTFFDPVFNIADSAITIGVGMLLLFGRKAFVKKDAELSEASF